MSGSGVTATVSVARGSASTRARRDRPALLARARAAAGDVERELARWCLLRLDLDADVLARLLPRGTDRASGSAPLDGATIDGQMDDAAYRALWGSWLGREREFYRESARRVNEPALVGRRAHRGRQCRGPRARGRTRPPEDRVHDDPRAPRRRPAADRGRRARARPGHHVQPVRPARAAALADRRARLLRRSPDARGARADPPGARHQRPAVAGATAGRLRRARGGRPRGGLSGGSTARW